MTGNSLLAEKYNCKKYKQSATFLWLTCLVLLVLCYWSLQAHFFFLPRERRKSECWFRAPTLQTLLQGTEKRKKKKETKKRKRKKKEVPHSIIFRLCSVFPIYVSFILFPMTPLLVFYCFLSFFLHALLCRYAFFHYFVCVFCFLIHFSFTIILLIAYYWFSSPLHTTRCWLIETLKTAASSCTLGISMFICI